MRDSDPITDDMLSALNPRVRNRVKDFLANCFEENSAPTIGMLKYARDDSLMTVAGLGIGTLAEIDQWLSSIGCKRDKGAICGEWYPIHTAPKDGLRRLIYLGYHGGERFGRWDWCGQSRVNGSWFYERPMKRGFANIPQPTHWMPLPHKPLET